MYFSEIWKKINDAIPLIIDVKRDDNKSFINNEEYDHRMEDVKLIKIITKYKTGYRNIHKYHVILTNNKKLLIKTMTYDNNGIR